MQERRYCSTHSALDFLSIIQFIKTKTKTKQKKKDPQYVNQQIYFKFNMLFVNNKLNETHILLVKQQIIGKPYLH